MPKPAERVSRLSTSDGYSHPSGPQLQTNQDPEVSTSLWTLWLVFMQAHLLLDLLLQAAMSPPAMSVQVSCAQAAAHMALRAGRILSPVGKTRNEEADDDQHGQAHVVGHHPVSSRSEVVPQQSSHHHFGHNHLQAAHQEQHLRKAVIHRREQNFLAATPPSKHRAAISFNVHDALTRSMSPSQWPCPHRKPEGISLAFWGIVHTLLTGGWEAAG